MGKETSCCSSDPWKHSRTCSWISSRCCLVDCSDCSCWTTCSSCWKETSCCSSDPETFPDLFQDHQPLLLGGLLRLLMLDNLLTMLERDKLLFQSLQETFPDLFQDLQLQLLCGLLRLLMLDNLLTMFKLRIIE